jgi:hypothetical protein
MMVLLASELAWANATNVPDKILLPEYTARARYQVVGLDPEKYGA